MKLDYFDLTGKVALVSGGAAGIGSGMAQGLAEAGASIVICSRRLEVCEKAAAELTAATGAPVLALRCDITNTAEINHMVQTVIEKLGTIDILVNCAGVGGSEKPILKMEESDWDSVMDINLKGAYNLARSVVPFMIEKGRGGRIINVASVGGTIAYSQHERILLVQGRIGPAHQGHGPRMGAAQYYRKRHFARLL